MYRINSRINTADCVEIIRAKLVFCRHCDSVVCEDCDIERYVEEIEEIHRERTRKKSKS